MDLDTAGRISNACQSAGASLASIVQRPSPNLPEAEITDLEGRGCKVLAYICDYLIQPASEASPDLNPYAAGR